jgi:parallel beta-helix repeat protein
MLTPSKLSPRTARVLLVAIAFIAVVTLAAVIVLGSSSGGAGGPTSPQSAKAFGRADQGSTPSADPTRTPTPTATPSRPSPSWTATQPPVSASSGPRTGSTYFVSSVGSDANPGTLNRPFRTAQHAADLAAPGSQVWLRGGSYAGFEVTRSGIAFASYPGETAVINAGALQDAVEFSGVIGGALRGVVAQGSAVQYGSAVKITASSNVTVASSTIRNNRTFGIVIDRSSRITIDGNRITGNADGIEERGAGNGVVISNNRIYGNVKAVDSGRGAEGINFYKSTGAITVVGNLLWDNGTHFEVYGASNLTITGNVTWNGQIMETGTDGRVCNNNRFVRNVGYRGSGFQGTRTNGMILRCASNMLVAQNTLDGFDQFGFDIVDGATGVPYGGSIAGLRVLNNIVVGGRAFSIDSALPASVQIDYNLVNNVGSTAVYGNHLAYVAGKGQFDTLSSFVAATGYEKHGVFGDPRFVNRSGRDYRLASGSPAINRGLVVLTDGYAGARPDLGRYERW